MCVAAHARDRVAVHAWPVLVDIKTLLEDLKPALLTSVQAEFDKVAEQKAAAPTRFVRGENAASGSSGGSSGGAGSAAGASNPDAAAAAALDELFPRVDVRPLISAKVLTDMNDKNWKVREEALQETLRILEEVKRIQPTAGDVLPALKARLGDSNKNLVALALQTLGVLATAMGKPYGKEYKSLLPTVLKSTPACARVGWEGFCAVMARLTRLEPSAVWSTSLSHCGRQGQGPSECAGGAGLHGRPDRL